MTRSRPACDKLASANKREYVPFSICISDVPADLLGLADGVFGPTSGEAASGRERRRENGQGRGAKQRRDASMQESDVFVDLELGQNIGARLRAIAKSSRGQAELLRAHLTFSPAAGNLNTGCYATLGGSGASVWAPTCAELVCAGFLPASG